MLVRQDSNFFPARRLRDEIDQLFTEFFGGYPLGNGSETRSSGFPPFNVWEDENRFVIEAEMPGMGMDDVEVTLQDNVLTLSGERKDWKPEGATEHRRERFIGSFRRTLNLPVDVDPDGVKAELRDGILSVELPKAKEARPRKIEVASAGL